MVFGYGGYIQTSTDGITWRLQTAPSYDTLLSGIAGSADQQLVAVGGIILRSDCGGGGGNEAATTLITHYYVSILEREPDTGGLAFWLNRIAENQAQGIDVKPVFRDLADFFFNSAEYLGRNTTDRQFITNLYLTFFQREPDEGGYAFWLEQLANGMTRNQAMSGFLFSPEFTAFMEALGF
ncbi:MAG: DUF4214 domain-containing protein [Candidatus Competibacteraceae bacterium]|nr:DUF4214 domain-containing protein [Candidatus Competibacteraceae bacterium]